MAPLDNDSKKAYVLAGLISAERECRLLHASSIHAYMERKYPKLQISYDDTLEMLHDLVKEGLALRDTPEGDDPVYHFNRNYKTANSPAQS